MRDNSRTETPQLRPPPTPLVCEFPATTRRRDGEGRQQRKRSCCAWPCCAVHIHSQLKHLQHFHQTCAAAFVWWSSSERKQSVTTGGGFEDWVGWRVGGDHHVSVIYQAHQVHQSSSHTLMAAWFHHLSLRMHFYPVLPFASMARCIQEEWQEKLSRFRSLRG